MWLGSFLKSSCYIETWDTISKNVKCSRYRPGVAQRVGRGIAPLFLDRGTIRGWVVSSTSRPHFTPGKDPVPILQEAGWAPGPVWKGGKSRPHRDSIPDRPVRSQSLYRLSYRATEILHVCTYKPTTAYAIGFSVTTDDRDSELLSSCTLRSELQGKYHRPVKKNQFSAQDSGS